MKLSSIVILLSQLIAGALAYSLAEGSIKVGDKQIQYGEFNTQEIKQLPIDVPKEKVDIEFKLAETLSSKPHQVVITLGNNKGLESSYVPNFVSTSQLFKLSIPVNKIPASLKSEDKLHLNLIVADSDSKQKNLIKSLGEIIPTDNLKSTIKYKKANRVGIKPEIHHIFKIDESTVNPIIPVAFIGVAISIFLALIGSWAVFIGSDLFGVFKNISGLGFIHNFGFLASIIGFEISFADYYLGASIFKTLGRAFLLGLAGIFFGSKILSNLALQRKAGRV